MQHRQRFTLLTAGLAAAVTLTACGGEGGDAASVSPEHNDADVTFAQMMIPHHEQAVEMSELVLDAEGVPEEVTDLAERIRDAQGPEIEQMRAFLEAWDAEEVPGHDMNDMNGMEMEGMMSESDLQALGDAEGAEAARLFLEGMVPHHEGAVAMAETEVADGENPEAVALAEEIVAAQEEEISEMESLLADL